MSDDTGGKDWELSEAIRMMGDAQASGDSEQIATAMRRHAEALTNATNEIMIPTLKTTLESVLKAEIGEVTRRLDNSDKARLDRNVELQELIDSRFDRMAGELDKLVAATTATAARLGKHDKDIEVLQGVAAAHATRLTTFETKIAKDIQSRLEVLEAENTRLSAENVRLAAVEEASKELTTAFRLLAERIGGALPTEDDQRISAELRVERDSG